MVWAASLARYSARPGRAGRKYPIVDGSLATEIPFSRPCWHGYGQVGRHARFLLPSKAKPGWLAGRTAHILRNPFSARSRHGATTGLIAASTSVALFVASPSLRLWLSRSCQADASDDDSLSKAIRRERCSSSTISRSAPRPARSTSPTTARGEIRLVKPGFETLTVNQPIPTPWYRSATDRLCDRKPGALESDRPSQRWRSTCSRRVIVPTDQLLDRANQLRQETMQGSVVPASAVGVAGAPPGATLIPSTIPPPPGAPAQSRLAPPVPMSATANWSVRQRPTLAPVQHR